MSLMADNPNLQQSLGGLEKTLNEYFGKKAPQLPGNVKDIIVALAPWFTLIGLILSIPLVLIAFGLGAMVAPVSFLAGPQAGLSYGVNYMVAMVVLAVSLVLEALAVPGLFSRSIKGWRFAYWAALVGFVSNLVQFNVVGGLIGAVIGFYFLFQIRDRYK